MEATAVLQLIKLGLQPDMARRARYLVGTVYGHHCARRHRDRDVDQLVESCTQLQSLERCKCVFPVLPTGSHSSCSSLQRIRICNEHDAHDSERVKLQRREHTSLFIDSPRRESVFSKWFSSCSPTTTHVPASGTTDRSCASRFSFVPAMYRGSQQNV